jgi:DNA-binding XRE family transcriptional regulator
MQLRELIKEIRRLKSWTQQQMADAMGVKQQNIQGMENAGSTLEKQWALFWKLVPICRELGLEQKLIHGDVLHVEKDVISYVEQATSKLTRGPTKGSKKDSKKARVGAVPARGHTGGSSGRPK